MTKIQLGTWYNLVDKEGETLVVLPFNGDDIGLYGLSGGWIHYIKSKGEKGFCGVSWFEEHSGLKVI